jgi:hypothetical protein
LCYLLAGCIVGWVWNELECVPSLLASVSMPLPRPASTPSESPPPPPTIHRVSSPSYAPRRVDTAPFRSSLPPLGTGSDRIPHFACRRHDRVVSALSCGLPTTLLRCDATPGTESFILPPTLRRSYLRRYDAPASDARCLMLRRRSYLRRSDAPTSEDRRRSRWSRRGHQPASDCVTIPASHERRARAPSADADARYPRASANISMPLPDSDSFDPTRRGGGGVALGRRWRDVRPGRPIAGHVHIHMLVHYAS